MIKKIGEIEFELIGKLQLEVDSAGILIEYMPRVKPEVRLNKYATGPFCHFNLPSSSKVPGVYAIIISEEIKYIGESEDLARRFGPSGYGRITSRNCHADGQATNCKINSLVLKEAKEGHIIEIWFYATKDRKIMEDKLIDFAKPPWNGKPLLHGKRNTRKSGVLSISSHIGIKNDFLVALKALVTSAEQSGLKKIKIRAGDLHRKVGGYPGPAHRMPSCCKAMKEFMKPGDYILNSPPKGAGANLVIEYYLPRH